MWYVDVFVDDKLVAASTVKDKAEAIELHTLYREYYGIDAVIEVTYDDDD